MNGPRVRHEIFFREEIHNALKGVDEANRAGAALSAEYRAGFQHALVSLAKAFDVPFRPLPPPKGTARMLLPDECE